MGSKGGLVFGLVVFVFLWVISTVLAIMFFSELETARQGYETAVEERREFVSDAELNDDEVMAVVSQSGARSAIRSLMTNNRVLRQKLTSETDSMEAIDERFTELGVPAGVSAADAIAQLKVTTSSLESRIAALESENAAAASEYEASIENFKSSRQSLEESLTSQRNRLSEIGERIDKVEETFTDSATSATSQIRNIATAANEQLEGKDAVIQTLRQELEETQRRLTELEIRIRQRRSLLGPDGLSDADGMIISVTSDQSLCYINLGEGRQLVRGLTFRVYDPVRGITSKGVGVNREFTEGKGIIEVIRISDNTAECRIIERIDGQAIVAGDVIANAVYDPNRKFRFFVYGDFDLDYDGRADDAGQDQIEAMIGRFGSRVVDRLNVGVDYVVVGNEPELPAFGEDAQTDPSLRAEIERQRESWEAWQQVVGEASRLGIPVLNQNRFLNLVGFYAE